MPRQSALQKKKKESMRKARLSKERKKHEDKPAATPSSPAAPHRTTTSAMKRKTLSSSSPTPKREPSENVVISKEHLEKLCKSVACQWCYESTVESRFVHHQADVYVRVTCSKCNKIVLNTVPDIAKWQGKRYYPVTLTLVYFMMMLGAGYTGVETLCGMLSFKHFTFEKYVEYSARVTKSAISCAKEHLSNSRKAVTRFYAETLNRKPDASGVLNTDVGFDGTWHTRGHTSLLGAGAVIDMHTGLIVDYATISKICVQCKLHHAALRKKKITEEEYERWSITHKEVCDINYEGTSGGMEAAAAVTMWNRSLEHNMRYMNFVCDGDSSAFRAVKDINNGEGPYGKDYVIEKWDCTNHVAKRLGTGLRNLRKETYIEVGQSGSRKRRSVLGGKNKLTDRTIDRLQHYFKQSIKRKVNTTEVIMRDEIMSSFYHCTSTDDNPQHHLCPRGEDSWCFFQAAVAKGETPKSHAEMKVFFTLPPEQLDLVKGVYTRLTTDEMMKRCLQGLTQNPNESFHSRIWQHCPKHLMATKRKLDFAIAVAAMEYNSGHVSSNLHGPLDLPYPALLDKVQASPERPAVPTW